VHHAYGLRLCPQGGKSEIAHFGYLDLGKIVDFKAKEIRSLHCDWEASHMFLPSFTSKIADI